MRVKSMTMMMMIVMKMRRMTLMTTEAWTLHPQQIVQSVTIRGLMALQHLHGIECCMLSTRYNMQGNSKNILLMISIYWHIGDIGLSAGRPSLYICAVQSLLSMVKSFRKLIKTQNKPWKILQTIFWCFVRNIYT